MITTKNCERKPPNTTIGLAQMLLDWPGYSVYIVDRNGNIIELEDSVSFWRDEIILLYQIGANGDNWNEVLKKAKQYHDDKVGGQNDT